MRSDEIKSMLERPVAGEMIWVVRTASILGLTPTENGVNAVEKEALTPWKKGR